MVMGTFVFLLLSLTFAEASVLAYLILPYFYGYLIMDVSSLTRKNIYPGDACQSDWFKG